MLVQINRDAGPNSFARLDSGGACWKPTRTRESRLTYDRATAARARFPIESWLDFSIDGGEQDRRIFKMSGEAQSALPPAILQQQITQQIAHVLVESRPEAWDTLEYRVTALAGYMEDGFYITDRGGQVTCKFPPDQVIDYVDDLRAAMYRSGAGTWFSAVITITRGGHVSANFNYDNEPKWETEPVAEAYAQDVRRFPRGESAMPAWLRARLAEAAAEASGQR